jgi:hypothetical protein
MIVTSPVRQQRKAQIDAYVAAAARPLVWFVQSGRWKRNYAWHGMAQEEDIDVAFFLDGHRPRLPFRRT